jgi:hypothetical protein
VHDHVSGGSGAGTPSVAGRRRGRSRPRGPRGRGDSCSSSGDTADVAATTEAPGGLSLVAELSDNSGGPLHPAEATAGRLATSMAVASATTSARRWAAEQTQAACGMECGIDEEVLVADAGADDPADSASDGASDDVDAGDASDAEIVEPETTSHAIPPFSPAAGCVAATQDAAQDAPVSAQAAAALANLCPSGYSLSCNRIAHITLSTSRGVPPRAANDMLNRAARRRPSLFGGHVPTAAVAAAATAAAATAAAADCNHTRGAPAALLLTAIVGLCLVDDSGSVGGSGRRSFLLDQANLATALARSRRQSLR